MNKKINIYPILIFLAGALWGSMGLFVHRLNDIGCSSLDIVVLRGVVTAVVMGIILIFKDKGAFKIRLKDIWVFIGTGVLSVVFFNFCYFISIMETSMSVAAVLLYTAPAFVMLMSRPLFKEKITSSKVISLVLAIIGCVFVSGLIEGGSNINVPGVLAGIGAGLGYALYSIFSRFAINKGYSTLTITFYTFFFSGIGSLPLTNPVKAISLSFSSLSTAVFSVLFVLISTVFPYLLYTLGLKGTENGRASIIASIEPVSATLLGLIVFGEVPSVYGFIGMLLVLTGIVVSNLKVTKNKI